MGFECSYTVKNVVNQQPGILGCYLLNSSWPGILLHSWKIPGNPIPKIFPVRKSLIRETTGFPAGDGDPSH
jgi:hypothetical protein